MVHWMVGARPETTFQKRHYFVSSTFRSLGHPSQRRKMADSELPRPPPAPEERHESDGLMEIRRLTGTVVRMEVDQDPSERSTKKTKTMDVHHKENAEDCEMVKPYGPWMLAPRRTYRSGYAQKGKNYGRYGKEPLDGNSGKGTELAVPVESKKYNQPPGKPGDRRKVYSSSRFAVLVEDDLNEEINEIQEELTEGTQGRVDEEFINVDSVVTKLKGKGKRPSVQISEKQINNEKNKSRYAENFKNAETHENTTASQSQSKSNQAAASDTHVVVRGRASDKYVHKEIINNEDEEPMMQGITELQSFEHHGDPPDSYEDCMEEDLMHETVERDGNSIALEGGVGRGCDQSHYISKWVLLLLQTRPLSH
nr:uncharacterized protein LOC109162703 [Ipomoea batatas]